MTVKTSHIIELSLTLRAGNDDGTPLMFRARDWFYYRHLVIRPDVSLKLLLIWVQSRTGIAAEHKTIRRAFMMTVNCDTCNKYMPYELLVLLRRLNIKPQPVV